MTETFQTTLTRSLDLVDTTNKQKNPLVRLANGSILGNIKKHIMLSTVTEEEWSTLLCYLLSISEPNEFYVRLDYFNFYDQSVDDLEVVLVGHEGSTFEVCRFFWRHDLKKDKLTLYEKVKTFLSTISFDEMKESLLQDMSIDQTVNSIFAHHGLEAWLKYDCNLELQDVVANLLNREEQEHKKSRPSLYKISHECPNLKILDIFPCPHSPIPAQIGNLVELRALDVHHTWCQRIPESIGRLKKLQYLIIDKHSLQTLPKSIGSLENLEYLNIQLSGHYLCSTLSKKFTFPKQIKNLRRLKILNVSAFTNETMIYEFQNLPDSLEKIIVDKHNVALVQYCRDNNIECVFVE